MYLVDCKDCHGEGIVQGRPFPGVYTVERVDHFVFLSNTIYN